MKQWWKKRTLKQMFNTWMAEQDRSGPDSSPVVPVPADAIGVTVRLTDTGYSNPAQVVRAQILACYDNTGIPKTPNGGEDFLGGDRPIDKQGNPVPREFGTGFTPGNVPSHLQIVLDVSGVVNCGVEVEFQLPEPPPAE